eukprot:8869287-Lingulodinium_polyedra.AAC.1
MAVSAAGVYEPGIQTALDRSQRRTGQGTTMPTAVVLHAVLGGGRRFVFGILRGGIRGNAQALASSTS